MANINMIPKTWALLITLIIMIPKSTSQPIYLNSICPNTTFIANNSRYNTNVNTLFQLLTSNAATNLDGFHYTSIDHGSTDAVYGLFMCRGDQSTASCHECVGNATSTLANVDCPNTRVGITWYDECMIRYSNETFLGSVSQTPMFRLMNTQNITGDMSHFMEAVRTMMNDVAIRAAIGRPRVKYATGTHLFSSLQPMYGLGQCTPDLSLSECYRCLSTGIGLLPTSIGGRTVMPSCNVRYEIYPFF